MQPAAHPARLALVSGSALDRAAASLPPVSRETPSVRLIHPGRAAHSLDPYCHIEKVPLVARDLQSGSAGFSVRRDDPTSPTGWRECGVVKADYLVVPNAHVRDLALQIAERANGTWLLDKEHFDGKRFTYALINRDPQRSVEVRPGDTVGYGLFFQNSYDGSTRLSASLVLWRLACSNGMLVPSYFRRVSFKHDHSSAGWESETEEALEMIRWATGGMDRFLMASQALSNMRLGSAQLREIRAKVLPKIPVTLWGQVVDRYLMHEELTGWGLLNAVTNRTWHAERVGPSDFQHNEYATTRMLEFGLGVKMR